MKYNYLEFRYLHVRYFSRNIREYLAGYLFILPALSVLIPFFIYPLFYALYLSLWGGKRTVSVFVGFRNYMLALENPLFWQSVKVTFYYTIMTVPMTLILGFVSAYLLMRIIWGKAFFRVLFFIPYVTSTVAVAMVWRTLYHPQIGTFNYILELIGLEPQKWLLEPRGILHILSGGLVNPRLGPSLALVSIALFDIWHNFGFAVVVFLAGMSSLPKEYYEAGKIDGANALQMLFHIELPLLSPTWLFLITVQLIRSMQSFSSFYALNPGGGRTLGTTENMMLHIYSQFYEYGYWGYGSAVAIILTILVILVTFFQWQWSRKFVFYQ